MGKNYCREGKPEAGAELLAPGTAKGFILAAALQEPDDKAG